MKATTSLGLLILRVGLGVMMMFHGYPKVMGGMQKWEGLGAAGMGSLGIDFAPAFWGAAASFTELVGGFLLAIGLLTRVNAALLLFTMFVAAMMHMSSGDGLMGSSHAIEDGIAFLALLIIGPGQYALDEKLFND